MDQESVIHDLLRALENKPGKIKPVRSEHTGGTKSEKMVKYWNFVSTHFFRNHLC